MPTTFDVFYLGTGPEFDTVEGNSTSENHAALQGLTFGGTGSPLALNVQVMSPDPAALFSATGNAVQYDVNNASFNEKFLINGGAPQTHDAQMTYTNSLITYTDGTTALVSALVMQDTAGRLYLLPPSTANSYSAALMAKPILSLTLGTASPQFGTNVWGTNGNRFDMALRDFDIEGTAGNDLINNAYTTDPDGDRIDDTDALDGSNNDYITAGAGSDTVFAANGSDTIYGGDGNDILYGEAGNDIIYGGAGNDTVYGGADNDILEGEGGNDILYGDAGNDQINGGLGGDRLYGGTGSDVITAGDGDDIIEGGTGADTLSGGTGADTFALKDNSGADVITDFDITRLGTGFSVDQFDVSGMVDAGGAPVRWDDVVVTDTVGDGTGDAVLTFPNGETVILSGLLRSQVEGRQNLIDMGIPCFVAGTPIKTPSGWRAVEDVRKGDYVWTSQGPARVIWAGSRVLSPHELLLRPELKPVHFPVGAIGNTSALRVSPQHAVQMRDASGKLVLVRAKHLAETEFGGARVANGVRTVSYHHVLLERHGIMCSAGAMTESFYPGAQAMSMFDWGSRIAVAAAILTNAGARRHCDEAMLAQIYGPRVHSVLRRSDIKGLSCPALQLAQVA